MTAIGLFLDGPKAGETMRWTLHAPRSVEVFPPQDLGNVAIMTNDPEPIHTRIRTVTYRIFMAAFDQPLYLYSCGTINPWETLTEVLAPLLKLARAETEKWYYYRQ